jgi:hypothetical protein
LVFGNVYFETDVGDGFREPGFPQGTASGAADHHRLAARRDRVPVDGQCGRDDHDGADDPGVMAAHQLPDVTVMADAGTVSAANQQAIEAASLVAARRNEYPGQEIPDGQVFTQP